MKNGFRWNLSFTYTRNKSLVEEIYPGLTQLSLNSGQAPFSGNPGNGFGGGAVVLQKGQPYGTLFMSTFQKDPNGNVVVDPTTGYPILSTNDQVVGNIQPDYLAGISNTFSYKNLSLSFTFDIRQGGKEYSRTKSTMIFAGTDPITTYNNREPFVVPNSVIQNSDGSFSPNTTPIQDVQTYWANFVSTTPSENLVDASYIKLRELSLSYRLPEKWLKHTFLSDATFSITGRNLWIKTAADNHYIDPEASSFGNGNSQGFEYGSIPSVKTIGANIRVTF
jgi:hypothetical protein